MKNLRLILFACLLCSSFFLTGCNVEAVMQVIQNVSEGIKQAAPAISEVVNTIQDIIPNDSIRQQDQNLPAPEQPAESDAEENAAVVINPPDDQEEIDNNNVADNPQSPSVTPPVETDENPAEEEEKKSPAKPGTGNKTVLDVPQQKQMAVDCPAPKAACAPTSLAMAIAYYTGKPVDKLASDLYEICGTKASGGTSHKGIMKGAQHYGFANAKWNYAVGESWLRKKIKEGKPVVVHVKGHYVVVTGMDNKGNVYYNDPGKSKVAQKKSYEEFEEWWTRKGNRAAFTLD